MSRLKDKVINHWLSVKNFFFHVLSYQPEFNIPVGYKCAYLDDFTIMNEDVFDKKYIRQQRWGNYHPDDLSQWYDPKAVELSGGLVLKITNNTLNLSDGNIIMRGVGLVQSKNTFGYGIYEWKVKLPVGKKLWPAVWVGCRSSWPPEIDIVEGYSDIKGKYKNKLNSNVWLGKDTETEKHFQLRAMSHGFLCDTSEPIKFTLHWEKDFVKIYYNDFLVRKIENKDDLEYLNMDPNVVVVLNTATNVKNQSPLPLSDQNKSPMVVEYFKYFKK